VFNNSFRYKDPDGRFIIALPLLALTWKVVAIAIVTAYVSYELEHQHEHSNSALARGFNSAVHQTVQHIGGVSQYALNQKLDMAKKEKKPPYDGKELGDDPTKCPGEGFEWKGKGNPGSGQGSWVKGAGETKEVLYPDLDHPAPIGPHWDYTGPAFPEETRLYPNETWEIKP